MLTAIRTSTSPSSFAQSWIASAARTARSGSSSREIGAPKTATTASPMNFSTVPPQRELFAEALVIRPQHGRDVLRVERLGPRCEADEVGEEDRDDLALLARRRAHAIAVISASAWRTSRFAPSEDFERTFELGIGLDRPC